MGADQITANHGMKLIFGVFAALLVAALIVLGLFWARGGLNPAAGDTQPSATSAPDTLQQSAVTPGQIEAPADSAPAAQGAPDPVAGLIAAPAGQLPGSCDQLYSTAMVDTLTAGNLALNPARLNDPGANVTFAPADEQLRTLIDANESLQCIWVTPEGGSGIGIGTAVVLVDAVERDQVTGRLRSLGFSCVDEREGLRCETESSSDEGTFGESHFLRDDLWVSTQYGDVPLPEGYTLDIINSLWPLGK
jgi:hypothetical protein